MNKVMKRWTTKSGLEAVVLFVGDSHNCGFVELPEHLKKYNFTGYNGDNEYTYIEVHGRVTYQGTLGDKDVVGFDCAHMGDKSSWREDGIFRTVEFCEEECEKMAEQLSAL